MAFLRMKKPLFAFILLTIGSYASADTHYAASVSYADVSAAIASADPGDTVIVPSGNATWDNQLVITKGIYLIGAGSGNTNIKSNYTGYGNVGTPTKHFIVYQPSMPANNEPFRLSGFSFDCDSKCAWLNLRDETTTPITKVRIDHNVMVNGIDIGIYMNGPVYGVIDNNTIDFATGATTVLGINNNAWLNFEFSLGTADNIYIEDNIFNGTASSPGAHSCSYGGRYCARYNTYNVSTSIFPLYDMHGNQPPTLWAVMGAEFYSNTVNTTGSNGLRIFDQRGGKLMAYNNNVVSSAGVDCQAREEYIDTAQSSSQSDGGQPMHVSGSYYWNNTKNGSTLITPSITGTVDYGDPIGDVPQWDVDCWKQETSFDGSTGMGIGLLAARPSSGLTVGVGYWATDTNTLYRATGATTWETYYMPYTYLHPLRTDCITYPGLCDSGTVAINSVTDVFIASMTAGWNLASGATGYTLAASTNSYNPPFPVWASSTTIGINATTATVYSPALSVNATYYLFVRANQSGSSSSYSAYPATVTLAVTPSFPIAVSTFTNLAASSFAVSWSSGTPLVGWNPPGTIYRVERSTASGFNGTSDVESSTRPAGAPSFNFTGLAADATYYVQVKAVNHRNIQTGYFNLGSTKTLSSPALPPPTYSADLINVIAGPNPVNFSKAVGGKVKFTNLTRNATVSIYDIKGRLVKEMSPGTPDNDGTSGRAEWSGKNEASETVGAGLYFFLVTDDSGNKKTGRIAVVK